MKGYPKHINTRTDIEHLMSFMGTPLATAENLQQGHAYLTGLLNTQHYVFDRVLADGESADGPEPDYKVMEGQGANEDERHQFVLADNPRAPLYRMGLTATEVQDWIAQLEEAM